MALILNTGLPAGSTGLYWFPQGLENLGTGATGDAVLGGDSGNTSVLTGGQVVHDNELDWTKLTTDSHLLSAAGATAGTIMWGSHWTDTGLPNTGGLGTDIGQLRVYFPWSDSKIYWDVGGNSEGTSRLSVSVTKDTSTHVWAVTFGARGMEIWQDGSTIATNAATPTSNASGNYRLGPHTGFDRSPLIAWDWVFFHTTQLSTTLISDISADPGGELTATATTGSPWLHYAQLRRG